MNRFKSVTDGTADRTTSHLTDKTTSHSTGLSKNDNQVAGYKPLRWLMALLLVAFVAGCGGGNGSPADTTAPTVSFILPANAATGIALNTNITATFSEAMNPSTITPLTFTLKQGTASISGAVTYVGKTAVFNPNINLLASTIYTAMVTTGVKDLAGNALAVTKTWSFTTGTTADNTLPTVSSTLPADTATGIVVNANITATFSEAMDPSTVTAATFTLKQGTTPISGAVSNAGTTATFNPNSNLAANTTYTATVTTGVKDLAGNALAVTKTWSFTTGTTVAAGPKPVVLGTSGNFVILTKSGITNVPTSAITGNIGSSPITAAAMDNVFCSEITGTIYGVDAAYTGSGTTTCFAGTAADKTTVDNAVLDMGTAFTDAAGRTSPDHTELYAGDISGRTLAPGLYKWGTGVLITSAGVTLSGGANDVWIFQIAQDLTVDNGAIVTLSPGVQAKNVFWQVSGQATLGTTANFKGIILSQTLISLNTGAVLHGRALAQTAVTLNATTVGP
jgi:hypothetical protein